MAVVVAGAGVTAATIRTSLEGAGTQGGTDPAAVGRTNGVESWDGKGRRGSKHLLG